MKQSKKDKKENIKSKEPKLKNEEEIKDKREEEDIKDKIEEKEIKTKSEEKDIKTKSEEDDIKTEKNGFMIKIRNLLNKNKRIINYIVGIIFPIAIIFISEYIQRQSISNTCIWMFNNIGIVVLNFLIIYGIFNLIQLIFNKTTISVIFTSLVYFIFSIISYLKYEIRGEVLIINDFSLVNQAEGLLSFIEPQMILKLPIIFAIMFLLFTLVFFIFYKVKTKRKNTLIKCVCICLISYFIFVNNYTSGSLLKVFGIDKDIRYNMNSVYENEGIALALYSNIIMNRVEEPIGYSKEKIFAILDKISDSENLDKISNSDNNDNNNSKSNISNVLDSNETSDLVNKTETKPNVIMIMSESFFDPTVLKNVEFSEDPIPNVRQLINNYTSGKFISSTFAGGTSNIEFEAFTGNTIAYMPYGAVPYTDIKENIKNTFSLPKIMKDNGYKAIALHTYDKTFYDRDINYNNLGFDEFIGVDELYEPKYFGKYVSDETFTDNIIKIIEDNQSKPLFIWGVTMQNHTPYSVSNYDDTELKIKISGDSLSEEALDKLTAYTNGIYESDKAMKKLVDYLENSDTPTVVLFFGDHLPSQYAAYFDTGLIHTKDTTKWNVDEMLNLHTIPFFIYDNFNFKTDYSHDEFVGAVFLGNYLCNYINLEKPIYFKFLDTLTFKAMRDRLFVDKDRKPYDKVTDEYKEQVEEHKLLQYDIIYGNRYIYEYKNTK